MIYRDQRVKRPPNNITGFIVKKRIFALLLLIFGVALTAWAQTPPVVVYPAGAYTVTTPDPTSIIWTATSITFSWGPTPVPPAPPVPPLPPVPPDPPSPIPSSGLRVLIIYESADLTKYPPAQTAILYDQSLRTYLDSVSVLGPDMKTHEYRIWDKDVNLVGDSQLWKGAMSRSHPQLPWIVIANGVVGYEGPLPANTTDTIALVKKYEAK